MALAITSTNLKTRDTVSDTGEYTHTSRDDLLRPDAVIQINGTDFGATQGNSNVYVADGTTFATANKVLQTVSSWADTLIELTVDLGTFNESDELYIFVAYEEGEIGEVISSAHWVTIAEQNVHIDAGIAMIPAGCGDDFVLIPEQQLGFVPKYVNAMIRQYGLIDADQYFSAGGQAYIEASIVYDVETDSFNVVVAELFATSHSTMYSKVHKLTDQLAFSHYHNGSEETATFDLKYVKGKGIVIDYDTDTRTIETELMFIAFGGRTVKAEINVEAASAETTSFGVEPSFCKVYSVNTTSSTTNKNSDGRLSIGIVDRKGGEYCAVASDTDQESYHSTSAFGARNDGAGGADYNINTPDFSTSYQLDWTASGSATNQSDKFFIVGVDLDGYWGAVNTHSFTAAATASVSINRDPQFINILTNFDGTSAGIAAGVVGGMYHSSIKSNKGLGFGDSKSWDQTDINHAMQLTIGDISAWGQIESQAYLTESGMNGYSANNLNQILTYIDPDSDFGTSTSLASTTYGSAVWFGGNDGGFLSVEKLDDRPVISSAKANGNYESTWPYPEHVLKNGSAGTITGTGFSATKGTQKVYLCDALCLDDATVYEELSTSSWSATSITLSTLDVKSWMRHTSKGLYIFIADGTNQTSSAYPVTCIDKLDDSHVSYHTKTYTGTTRTNARRDYQLVAESSFKDKYPKGFLILINRSMSNGLEANTNNAAGPDQCLSLMSIDWVKGTQRTAFVGGSTSRSGSGSNEACLYHDDFIYAKEGKLGFRHMNPDHGSSRYFISGNFKYVPGSGLYIDVLSDYESTDGDIQFNIICFYGASTFTAVNTVKNNTSSSDDIEKYFFGFRPNALVSIRGATYGTYASYTMQTAVGFADKDANVASYYQKASSSSSQEGFMTDAYLAPYSSSNTSYYWSLSSYSDDHAVLSTTSGTTSRSMLALWRGTLDSSAELGTVATTGGLSSSTPNATSDNVFFFYIFSDNSTTTYAEDYGPYSLGFALNTDSGYEYSYGAMVDLDSSELFAATRDDACGIIPTSTSAYTYIQVDDYNYSGGDNPRLNFLESGTSDNNGSKFVQFALEAGTSYLIQDEVATVNFSIADGTLQETGGGSTIEQDATFNVDYSISDGTLSLGTATLSQDVTFNVDYSISDGTFSLGSNTISQDASAAVEYSISDGTLDYFAAQDSSFTVNCSMSDATLLAVYYLEQDATVNVNYSMSDGSLSASATINQDATFNVDYSITDATLNLGSNTITQDVVVAVEATISDGTLDAGTLSITQDASVAVDFAISDGSIALGSNTIAQDVAFNVDYSISDGTLDEGSVSITQDASVAVEFTMSDGSLSFGSGTITQDATFSVEATISDSTLSLGTVNILQDAGLSVNSSISDGSLSVGPSAIVQDAGILVNFAMSDGTLALGTSTLEQDAGVSAQTALSDGALSVGPVTIAQDSSFAIELIFSDGGISGAATIEQDSGVSCAYDLSDGTLDPGSVSITQDLSFGVEFTFSDGSVGGDITFVQDATFNVDYSMSDATLSLGASTLVQDISFAVEFSMSDGTLATGGGVLTQDATFNVDYSISDATLSLGTNTLAQDISLAIESSISDATISSSVAIVQDASVAVQYSISDGSLSIGSNAIVQDVSIGVEYSLSDGSLALGSNTLVQDATISCEVSFGDGSLTSINYLIQDTTFNVDVSIEDATISVGGATASQDASFAVEFSMSDASLQFGSILDFELVYCEYKANNRFAKYTNKSKKYFAKY